jgi:hypothetical protein
MSRNLFWLSDAQWARIIEPVSALCPHNQFTQVSATVQLLSLDMCCKWLENKVKKHGQVAFAFTSKI